MTVIQFRRGSHGRASVIPKTPGLARSPRNSNSSETNLLFFDEIRPRDFQLDTAERVTPTMDAALAVPPRASITASTESSMGHLYSQIVNKSTLHGMAIVTECELALNVAMNRSTKDLKLRLQATQTALGISSAKLCRETGIATNTWSQFLSLKNKRRITMAAAYKLKDTYGVPLDWTYDADPSRLPADLRDALRNKAA